MSKKPLPFIIMIGIFVAIYSFSYVFNHKNNEDVTTPVEKTNDIVHSEAQALIKVHVSGEVKNAGVYECLADERVEDAIQKAGGATIKANLDQINLAAFLEDGKQIHVPKQRDENETNSYININYATKEELQTLPGIGETLAKSIIDFRDKHGFFQEPEDIMNVSGIKEKTFENIKDLIVTK